MGADTRELDPDAVARFDELYRAHLVAVVAYAARRVPADGVADVVSETFVVAWRRLDRVPDNPLPWLLAVARRVAANQRRGQQRRQALTEKAAAQPAPPAAGTDSEHSDVIAALDALPERDREVLRLAAWESLSAAEAADVLGCTVTAYRLRLFRARRKLATSLGRAMPSGQPEQVHSSLEPRSSTDA